jgi:hypothetical protein
MKQILKLLALSTTMLLAFPWAIKLMCMYLDWVFPRS